jgi:hypothetical protein
MALLTELSRSTLGAKVATVYNLRMSWPPLVGIFSGQMLRFPTAQRGMNFVPVLYRNLEVAQHPGLEVAQVADFDRHALLKDVAHKPTLLVTNGCFNPKTALEPPRREGTKVKNKAMPHLANPQDPTSQVSSSEPWAFRFLPSSSSRLCAFAVKPSAP